MNKNLLPCLSALLLAGPLTAAPLMRTTAIHSQPDAKAPPIGYLKAGTEPVAAPNVTAPDGWMAVTLPGPHDAYVHNNDLSKDLTIRPGAPLLAQPQDDAPVLATMEKGDKIQITGLRPGWTQVKLSKDVIGYIRIGGEPTGPEPVAASPAAAGVPPPPPPSAAQTAPNLSGGPPSPLARTFQGILVPTQRFLLVGPRRDYPYQLNDTDGRRIAYLDVSRLSPTVRMEKYLNNPVTLTGALRQTADGKHLVIQVVTLDLR